MMVIVEGKRTFLRTEYTLAVVCDVCGARIEDASAAIVVFPRVGGSVTIDELRFLHKGACDRKNERLAGERGSWDELRNFLQTFVKLERRLRARKVA
jgi:hypothetical protein